MGYTGQSYEGLPEEVILEELDFFEIATNEQIVRFLEDGTTETLTAEEYASVCNFENGIMPMATWTSDDGYMKIATAVSTGTKTSAGTQFTLSATATWLKYPLFRLKDTLAITYGNATFDDSHSIISTFKETGKCEKCGKTFTWEGTEQYGNSGYIKSSSLIELDFAQSHAVGTKCDLKTISCNHTDEYGNSGDYATTTSIVSTIQFRVLASTTTEARTAYAHSQVGGSITISGSVSGTSVTPTFSGSGFLTAKKYSAAPVTLRCSS